MSIRSEGNGLFGMKWSFPRLDEAVSAPLGDLAQSGRLDRTLIAVFGEFGRTPKFEGQGHAIFLKDSSLY